MAVKGFLPHMILSERQDILPAGFEIEEPIAPVGFEIEKPEISLPEGFEIEKRKSLGVAIKHGVERAGVGLVKGLVGLVRAEAEIGGGFRKWVWEKTPLGRKPGYLDKMDTALGQWASEMGEGLETYYKENTETAIQLDEDAGFLETTFDVIIHPEKLLQGVTEAIPLMLEASLGTLVAGPGGGIVVMSQPKLGEVYEDARREETEPMPALVQAMLTGTGEAAIEQWTFGKKLGLAKGFTKMVKKGGRRILWEGAKLYGRGTLEEGTQQINENVWRWVFTDRSQNITEGVAQAMAIGGPLEAVMGGFFAGGGAVHGKMTSRKQQLEMVKKIKKGVEENPSFSEESKNELTVEFEETVDKILRGEFEAPAVETQATEEFEFSEEVAEGETYSEAQVADSVVEGQEVEPVVEELSEPDERSDVEQSIDRLNDAIGFRVLPEIRKLTEIEQSMQLGERVGKAEVAGEKARKEGFSVDEAQRVALGQLRGEMVKAKFPVFETNEVSPQDFENIRVAIWEKLRFFERTHALEAVNKLQDGLVPTESELRDLGKIIGKENAEVIVTAAKGKAGKVQSFFINLINFPTTTLASSEVSFIGRQGITTLPKWPKQWLASLGANYKAFFSSDWANVAQLDMQTDADFESFVADGGFFAEMGGDVTKQHERFHSEWAKQIPFFGALVRASERAAVVGPNKLRLGIYKFVKEQWAGLDQPTSEYQRLAKIVNISTGRGQINNKRIRAIMPYLNAGFFSPLYFKSRVDMIGETAKSLVDIATGTPNPTSMIMASQLVNFVIAGGLAMTIAAVLGAKVERDPRSSDYGKIQLGRMRIDVWGGFQQIARSTAQLITGRSKAVSSGEIFTKSRLETFGRFVQSKLSPFASLGIELLSGKDFLGEPIPTFENKADLFEWAIFQKLAPLILQDTVDAIRYSENRAATALVFPLAFHGIGVQTYETNALDDLTQMRDHYSTRVFGKEWKNIGPLSQDALREYKPQIVEQEVIAKFERRNASFDVKRQREAGVTVEKSLPRNVRKEMDRVAVSVGGLSRTIVRNWRLNADLYKKYQDDLSFLLNKVLPRVISKPGYQSQSPEVRQKILEFIIKEAKSAVRKNIVLKANMRDIEDIREGVEQEFDPSGSGFDIETFKESGGVPDETGHMGSLDPRTGMLLKGINHPTIQKTIEEEERRGNKIVKKGSRFFSVKK